MPVNRDFENVLRRILRDNMEHSANMKCDAKSLKVDIYVIKYPPDFFVFKNIVNKISITLFDVNSSIFPIIVEFPINEKYTKKMSLDILEHDILKKMKLCCLKT